MTQSNIQINPIPVVFVPRLKFVVRFQHIKLYSIEVEAHDANDADQKALELFKDNEAAAQHLHSNFGHMTVEQVK